jgi:Family of unknown function (DUF5906)
MITTLDRKVAAGQATQDRLRLLELGYTPLPSKGKLCILRGWPSLQPDEAMVKAWGRNLDLCSSGIRLEGRQIAIDLDVLDEWLVERMLDKLFDHWPELNYAPERIGRAPKVLYLAQLAEGEQPLTAMSTKHWVSPDGDPVHVEVFGGGRSRFIGWAGPHTVEDKVGPDGWIVHRTYGDRGSLVPALDLPVIRSSTLRAWLADCDTIFALAGYKEHRPQAGASSAFVRDLEENMEFDCDDGVIRTGIAAMVAYADHDEHARCALSFNDFSATNTTRCRVSLSDDGELRIFDFGDWVTHAPKGGALAKKPIDMTDLGGALAAILAVQQPASVVVQELETASATEAAPVEQGVAERAYIDAGGDLSVWMDDEVQSAAQRFEDAMQELQYGMAYDTVEEATRRIDDSPEIAFAVARRAPRYANRSLLVIGPKGGRKQINPMVCWSTSKRRLEVEGVRFMPGAGIIFEEDGRRWLNLWREPEIDPALIRPETIEVWLRFMVHLIPDDREREWFERFVANKLVNPRFRGAGVLMVAASTQGAGRSTLMSVLHEVFGRYGTYVSAAQLFDSQQRNGWMEKALWAFGNEIGFSTRYNDKVQAYERLKDLVDPAQNKVRLDEKYQRPRDALIYTTFLLATNRPDALPISADDRRFMVITNGGALGGQLKDELFGRWFVGSAPGEELVHSLRAYYQARAADVGDTLDLVDAPKWAEGREELIDAGRTDVDEVFEQALARIPADRVAMTREAFEQHLLGELRVAGLEHKRGAIRHFVTGLQGAEAARWGWINVSRVRLGGRDGDRARLVIRDTSIEYFMALSGEDRSKVLENKPVGAVSQA